MRNTEDRTIMVPVEVGRKGEYEELSQVDLAEPSPGLERQPSLVVSGARPRFCHFLLCTLKKLPEVFLRLSFSSFFKVEIILRCWDI